MSVKPGSIKVTKDDEDDPIAKSLKERLAAGGLTEVVTKPGGSKPVVSQPGLKRVPKPKDSTTEACDTQVPTPKAGKAAGFKEEKKEGDKPKLVLTKQGTGGVKKGDDSDDPIA